MYDQNDQTGQSPAPQNNPNPYGQLPANDGALGVAHDPTSNPSPTPPPPPSNGYDDPTPPPPPAPPDDNQESPSVDNNSSGSSSGNLLDIKQAALQQLNPLVEHLDQSPEERFKTTMMMIQASDDQSLIQSAYDSAQEITDEKARAQALLDVINEINYFTQQNNN